MELEFIKNGNRWEAEFAVEKDFNLHIEREGSGYMYISQRTSDSGKYDVAHSFVQANSVIDVDIQALVYPKSIKVVSEVKPTLAVVTFNE